MSNLQVLNQLQERQTPIELALQIDADGNTTSKALYEFLELDKGNYSRWCKKNIEGNPYAEENADFWAFVINEEWGGQASTDYKLASDFAKKLAMASGSPKGEEAREYFVMVEQNAKKLINNKPQTQIQILAAIAQQMAEQEQIAIAHTYQLKWQRKVKELIN